MTYEYIVSVAPGIWGLLMCVGITAGCLLRQTWGWCFLLATFISQFISILGAAIWVQALVCVACFIISYGFATGGIEVLFLRFIRWIYWRRAMRRNKKRRRGR